MKGGSMASTHVISLLPKVKTTMPKRTFPMRDTPVTGVLYQTGAGRKSKSKANKKGKKGKKGKSNKKVKKTKKGSKSLKRKKTTKKRGGTLHRLSQKVWKLRGKSTKINPGKFPPVENYSVNWLKNSPRIVTI
tara:strand:- start:46 stop:444 length:399 start_codon:yes stop_codon:yes gene_type:complete